jgi:hypothetical protein
MFVKTLVENSLFTIKPASEVLNFIPNYKEALVG